MKGTNTHRYAAAPVVEEYKTPAKGRPELEAVVIAVVTLALVFPKMLNSTTTAIINITNPIVSPTIELADIAFLFFIIKCLIIMVIFKYSLIICYVGVYKITKTKLTRISILSFQRLNHCKSIYRKAKKLNDELYISNQAILDETIDYYIRTE
jgi:hypothetical protein